MNGYMVQVVRLLLIQTMLCQPHFLHGRPVPAGRLYRPASAKHSRDCVIMKNSLRIHKALDTQLKSVLDKPEDVTFECLTQLRRPDLERLKPFIKYWNRPRTAGMPAHTLHSNISSYSHPQQPQNLPASITQKLALGGSTLAGQNSESEQWDEAGAGEEGPLSSCAPFMDAAARRVLPGHLLRRCRILSTFQLGNMCQQRVALTSCTGEELVTVWKLSRVESPSGGRYMTAASAAGARIVGSGGVVCPLLAATAAASMSSGSSQRMIMSTHTAASSSLQSGAQAHMHHTLQHMLHAPGSTGRSAPAAGYHGSGSKSMESNGGSQMAADDVPATLWLVDSISRDDSNDEADVASVSKPHPRLSPELVVKCQLAALRRGDIPGAAVFNMWSRSLMGNWESQLVAFRSKLRQLPYHHLLTHESVELGRAALPTQRQFVQCVKLKLPSPGGSRLGLESGSIAEFVFTLGMQANGCWMVTAIIPKQLPK